MSETRRCFWGELFVLLAEMAAAEPADVAFDSDDSGDDSEPIVRLGFLEDPEEYHLLQPRFFPSKVGGRPAWLNPQSIPTSAQLQCGFCGRTLQFLLQACSTEFRNSQSRLLICWQIYAPGKDDAAFHRSLFVFVCRNADCHQHTTSRWY